MFRRLFWMGLGAFVGLWGRSKIVRTVEKYVPTRIAKAAERTVKTFAKELATAGKEARSEMKAKESELRNSPHATS